MRRLRPGLTAADLTRDSCTGRESNRRSRYFFGLDSGGTIPFAR